MNKVCTTLKTIKEKIIFENEKNNPFRNAETFRKKIKEVYKIDVDYSKIYRDIINYQTEQYGCMLNEGKWVIKPTQQDCCQNKKTRMRNIKANDDIKKLQSLENRAYKRKGKKNESKRVQQTTKNKKS